MSDSLVGVGIVFKHDKQVPAGTGALTVVALVPGGPAVESGNVHVGMKVRAWRCGGRKEGIARACSSRDVLDVVLGGGGAP